jgi:hypothetical protein
MTTKPTSTSARAGSSDDGECSAFDGTGEHPEANGDRRGRCGTGAAFRARYGRTERHFFTTLLHAARGFVG